jgi:membrane-associated phospholipid phosphatase
MDLVQLLYTIKKFEIQVFCLFSCLNRTALFPNVSFSGSYEGYLAKLPEEMIETVTQQLTKFMTNILQRKIFSQKRQGKQPIIAYTKMSHNKIICEITPDFHRKNSIHAAKYARIILLTLLFCFLCTNAFGREQTNETESGIVPLSMVFHNIGWNALHSVTYNYGINFIGAGLGTWAFIGSGLDWKWNRLAYNNEWMPMTGGNANYIGYAVPILTPLTLYLTGLSIKNEKLQITGMALTQSLMLTLLIQTPLRIVTGRTWPGIVDGWDSVLSKRSDRADDYSGEFNWFNLDATGGWPSGHTANAFSAAATIAQIYHDNIPLKVAVYTYASLLGLCMSVYDHWASDVMAGVLIGFAVGTTVGKSYRDLIDKKNNKLTFYAASNSLGVIVKK